MKESIGYTYLLNLMIFFIFVTFAIVMAIMSYSRSFKVNSEIMRAIEVCEGYNDCSAKEINNSLENLGYMKDSSFSCPSKDKIPAVDKPNSLNNYEMCVYYDKTSKEFNRFNGKKYRYGVLTYYHLDIPILNRIKLKIYTKTNWIYNFEGNLK